ncbi:hypothetical protein DPMN_067832 [Dreissena polymorpha]|uniref:Mab-21-like HhH/H2TH-like domain-containing protein n=1 Tax=Dreissena polymorpha TaxID=45954 RepID=A0A9D3YVZ5_DREPO|nr:hypothetical protein DPMN_067832 [Dreissena polymorpha]
MAEGGARRDDPDGVSKQGSVSSRQATVQWEKASGETCILMSWLGYGPEFRQARSDAYREEARLYSRHSNAVTMMIAGSKAEGLTRPMESDLDYLFVHKDVICLEDGVNAGTVTREITVLRSCSRMTYPGHCRLLLERRGTYISWEVNEAFCDDGNGRVILSSGLFAHNVRLPSLLPYVLRKYGVMHDRAGPSMPYTEHGVIHYDIVNSFFYCCPDILSKWASRPRHWPPPEAVQQVVSLGALLTPVGVKGSEYEHVEWRVCFNAGEIELVNNLNDTQIKLYVLLKMVTKDVLNPRKKEVTSFTLKNIVLWIAENNPQSLFHERSLLHWLHEGLDALRVALVNRELPYYMIPDRNLMAACGLEQEQKNTWISTITEMMDEGPRMILRLPKIRQAIIAHPEPFRWYSRKRMELELWWLMFKKSEALCRDENMMLDRTDDILHAIKRRIDEICYEVGLRMFMEGIRGSRVNELKNVRISMLM